jgi:hypothetical protein
MISDHVKDVCKLGQGSACCRYLLAGPTGFECGKLRPSTRTMIDVTAVEKKWTAQSDNCEGQQPEVLNVR